MKSIGVVGLVVLANLTKIGVIIIGAYLLANMIQRRLEVEKKTNATQP